MASRAAKTRVVPCSGHFNGAAVYEELKRSVTTVAAQGIRTLLMLFFLDEGMEAIRAHPL